MPLTNQILKKKFGEKHEKAFVDLSDGDGLIARWMQSGSITFYRRYRWDKKAAVLKLGRYPSMALKEARLENQKAKLLVESGVNPKKDKITYNIKKITIGDALNYWIDNYVMKMRKRPHNVTGPIYAHVIPRIGQYDIEDCKTQQWLNLFQELESVPSQARNILKDCKQAFRYCKETNYCDYSEISTLTKRSVGKAPKSDHRCLSKEELKDIWNYCNTNKTPSIDKTRLCVIILMLTGARSSELRLSKKEHFNFNNMTWTVPAENSKTESTIIRPITETVALYLLKLIELSDHEEYVLVCKNNLLIKESNFANKVRRVSQQLKQAPWSAHDFRHTISTTFGDLDIDPFVAEKLLGHELTGIMAIYNKGRYLNQQRLAMEKWIKYITS